MSIKSFKQQLLLSGGLPHSVTIGWDITVSDKGIDTPCDHCGSLTKTARNYTFYGKDANDRPQQEKRNVMICSTCGFSSPVKGTKIYSEVSIGIS